jgi:hypothetical protein
MCSCNKKNNRPRHATSPAARRAAAPKLSETQVRQMALRKQVNDAAIKVQQQQKIKTVKQRIIKDKLSH